MGDQGSHGNQAGGGGQNIMEDCGSILNRREFYWMSIHWEITVIEVLCCCHWISRNCYHNFHTNNSKLTTLSISLAFNLSLPIFLLPNSITIIYISNYYLSSNLQYHKENTIIQNCNSILQFNILSYNPVAYTNFPIWSTEFKHKQNQNRVLSATLGRPFLMVLTPKTSKFLLFISSPKRLFTLCLFTFPTMPVRFSTTTGFSTEPATGPLNHGGYW